MTYERIKKILQAEIGSKGITDIKLYRKTLEIIEDEELAEEFLLSDDGGFTRGQLNAARYKYEHEKKRYSNSKASNPVNAF